MHWQHVCSAVYVHCIILLQSSREPDKSQRVKKENVMIVQSILTINRWCHENGICFNCLVKTSIQQSFFVWSEREGETDFFTLSALFPLYFLPEDPRLQNVQSMLSMDRRQWNLPERRKKKKKGWKKREREMLLLPPCTTIQKDGVITQKTSPTCFFTLIFVLDFPEHWATITTRILGPHTG